jgi:hypothetical protein
MRDRYGSPNNAAAFWQAHHWYQNGTNYVPSDQLAYLHRGEAVVPASQNQGTPWQSGTVTCQLDGPATVGLLEGRAVTVVGGSSPAPATALRLQGARPVTITVTPTLEAATFRRGCGWM